MNLSDSPESDVIPFVCVCAPCNKSTRWPSSRSLRPGNSLNNQVEVFDDKETATSKLAHYQISVALLPRPTVQQPRGIRLQATGEQEGILEFSPTLRGCPPNS